MGELALPVVICSVIYNDKLLVLKRTRGDYVGLLALPGGKIDNTEHLSQSAIREIKEECGILCKYKEFLAVISENLVDEYDNVEKHLLLNLCSMDATTDKITNNDGGEFEWIPLKDIPDREGEFIPSDFSMIHRIILNGERGHFECVLKKNDEEYDLVEFESIQEKINK